MKKNLLLILCFTFAIHVLHGQTVLFQDNFESYTSGSFLVQQAGNPWTTWSNQPGGAEDALISTTQSNSPTKSVHVNNAADDIILKLGNKTSGRYSIKFYYFIPTGFGAYFNLQHFEAPGNEWAIEVYFGNNGTGNTTVNSVEQTFSHVMNDWIEIESIVDLDLDSAWLYIDASLVRSWIFSMQSNNPTGTKQLGGVNFYCGAIVGQTPQFFFDDVTYTQLVAGSNPPTIDLSTSNIATDGTINEIFSISNTGDQQMTFVAYPTFPQSGAKSSPIQQSIPSTNNDKLTIGIPISGPVTESFSKADKANELSYVNGLLSSGLGFGGNATVRSAVKFDYSFVNTYIGRELYEVTIGINDLPAGNTKIQIYERGSFSTPGAGTLLQEKPFTATTAASEITVTLDSTIYIDGKDIWIGWICDATGGTFPIGMDEGPKVAGVNWTSVGPGWSEIGATVDNNLYISGSLQGTSMHQWVSVSPQSGTLNGGGQQTFTLSFNTTGMNSGNYYAEIVVGCNDQNNEYSEVEVYLSIGASVNDEGEKVAISTFPNPVSEIYNVNSNTPLKTIEVFSANGQLVKQFFPDSNTFSFTVNDLATGIFTVVISTEFERVERKIIVQ